MSQPIVFYDIPTNDSVNRIPYSPNTWKIRYVLPVVVDANNDR